jgi:hypothetical protein
LIIITGFYEDVIKEINTVYGFLPGNLDIMFHIEVDFIGKNPGF